jgi:zinc transport system substrate-binding protein
MRTLSSLLLLCALLISACTTVRPDADEALTVSIGALTYPTRALVGDSVPLHILTPAGASPETYQPTPQQLTSLHDSRAYLRIGTLGFERTQLQRLVSELPDLPLVDTSEGLPLIDTPDDDHHDGGDPHTWMSVSNMKVIARNICRALCRLDSSRTTHYTRRLDRLEQHLDSLDADYRRRLAPLRGSAFLIYHPALAYLARDYGLQQLSIERDGKAPTAESLSRLLDTCRTRHVAPLFLQQEYSAQSVRLIADELHLPIVSIHPLSEQWEEEMEKIVSALEQTIGRR